MSIYDSVSSSLSGKGLLGSIQAGISSSIGGAAAGLAGALGGGARAKATTDKLGGMASNAAANLIGRAHV